MKLTKFYTAEEVANLTAGGRSYIRTKNNIVKGLAITKKRILKRLKLSLWALVQP